LPLKRKAPGRKKTRGRKDADEAAADEPLRAELLHSLPTRWLRLAPIERLVSAGRREEPPGLVPKWLVRQARLDELIRTHVSAAGRPVGQVRER
jgi:hypothetical protein